MEKKILIYGALRRDVYRITSCSKAKAMKFREKLRPEGD